MISSSLDCPQSADGKDMEKEMRRTIEEISIASGLPMALCLICIRKSCGLRGSFRFLRWLQGNLDQHIRVLFFRVVTWRKRMHKTAPSSIHSLQFIPGLCLLHGREALARRKRVLHPQYAVCNRIPPALRFADEISKLPVYRLFAQC